VSTYFNCYPTGSTLTRCIQPLLLEIAWALARIPMWLT